MCELALECELMSILNNIIKLEPKAPRLTIYGKPGVGKSTLAAQFPNPLFLLTEETGLEDVTAFPVAVTFKEIWNTVNGLLKEDELPYDTIVIDSVSKLDALVVKYILDEEGPGKNGKAPTLNSACGGYGGGTLRAQGIHRGFKSLMDQFQDRGITVIYIAHLVSKTLKSPDAEDYDVSTIVMNSDKCREVYIDDVDGVFYCKLKSFISETESGRNLIKSTGDRVIVTGSSESNVSKNRFSMPNEIDMSFEEIAKYIKFYNK
jgi:hypothetical protein